MQRILASFPKTAEDHRSRMCLGISVGIRESPVSLGIAVNKEMPFFLQLPICMVASILMNLSCLSTFDDTSFI